MGRHRQLVEEVKAAICSFEQLVTPDVPASTEALLKARLVLVQTVNSYIAHLGDCVAAIASDARLLRWKDAHEQVVELRRSYSEHISHFSVATIVAEWPSYRTSCRRLIAAMRKHLGVVAAWEPID